jgi:hypothetical protein
MILHPDGRVEGTAEELIMWKEMLSKKVEQEYYKKFTSSGKGYTPWITGTTSVSTGNCPNEGGPCYCTGACRGGTITYGGKEANH